MNATTTPNLTAAAGTILALDLGKYKSVACLYDRATATHRFATLDTTRDELTRLLQLHRPAVVVFEACALAGWVHDLCAELQLPCKVANTASEPGSSSTPSARPTRTTRYAWPSWRRWGSCPPSSSRPSRPANGGR